MKVYFTASARGKKDFDNEYRVIHETIESLGHKNIDDLLVKIDSDALYDGSHDDQVTLYKQAIAHIQNCDIVVLELSVHSLSMGYVMHKALEAGKPVIGLYLSKHEPYFALGIENDKLQNLEYDLNSIKEVLQGAFEYSEEQMDTRFNFFISPSIGTYLDWISKKKRLPRAVYLRRLITEDMKREKEYVG